MEQLPFPIQDIGEWWGALPTVKKEIQLDIVAVGPKRNAGRAGTQYLIGSCKYRNSKVGVDELALIQEYATAFTSANDTCYYYIFSNGGFTDGLQALASEGAVTLLTLEEMYGNETS